jgi:sec-independent protein translocase protein TatA
MTDAIIRSFALAFGLPGGTEWIVLLVIGLLIFGRRLPEVGRSLGRGIVEFKRGIKGIEDEIEDESAQPKSTRRDERIESQPPPRIEPSQHSQPREPARSSRDATSGAEPRDPYDSARREDDDEKRDG